MDDTDIYLGLIGLLTGVAGRIVVRADALTIGEHPDGALREAGELAVLDWDQTGGPVLADLDDAAPIMIERVGQVRTLGAILGAVELGAPDTADLDLLADVAMVARWLEERQPGGPADPLLRLGLAGRAVALDALGVTGEIHDSLAERRGTGVGALDPADLDAYTIMAMLRLTGPDKLALAASQTHHQEAATC